VKPQLERPVGLASTPQHAGTGVAGARLREHRFHEIDLLRFAAAFGVLLFHYTFRSGAPDGRSVVTFPELGMIFKYGYLGVDLFFIVSGFVILLTALDRNAREFIVSRVTRLYPAYWACVTLTLLAILSFGDSRFSATLPQYFVNLTMLQEFFRVSPLDGVYWTLAIELKFYFLVFLIVVAGQIHRLQGLLGAWLAACIFLDVVEGYSVIRFFLFPGHSYFFIAGAASLLVWLHGISAYRVLLLAASYAGAMFFSIAVDRKVFADYFKAEFDPLIIGILVSLGFAGFLLIAFRKTAWLDRREFLTLGALTYPLYLLHQNIGYMIFNAAAPYVPRYLLLIATTALMLALAYAVHHWIERFGAPGLKRAMMRALRLRGTRPGAGLSAAGRSFPPT
jgi:peptidoglycan/LPS O-acetylase OafA/YrhL